MTFNSSEWSLWGWTFRDNFAAKPASTKPRDPSASSKWEGSVPQSPSELQQQGSLSKGAARTHELESVDEQILWGVPTKLEGHETHNPSKLQQDSSPNGAAETHEPVSADARSSWGAQTVEDNEPQNHQKLQQKDISPQKAVGTHEPVSVEEEKLWGWTFHEGCEPERIDEMQKQDTTTKAVELLHAPVASSQLSSHGGRLFPCFLRGNCCERPSALPAQADTSSPAAPPPAALPKGKAKAKGKPKAKAPPLPPRRAPKRCTSTPPKVWKGPQPSPGTKSQRVVNWNPIRQSGLLEGSIWQQVNQKIEQREHHLIAKETLDKAFTRSATESQPGPAAPTTKRRAKKSERRVLPPKEALMADLLHCQLAKQGLADLDCLRSAVGGVSEDVKSTSRTPEDVKSTSLGSSDFSSSGSSYFSSSSSSCESSDSDSDTDTEDEPLGEQTDDIPMDEDALQTLLTFLSLADGIEDRLTAVSGEPSTLPLAAPERLLQQVLTRVGPASMVRSRVQIMLSAKSFPKEADELEATMRSGIQAARAVASSTALPVLLEGVLVLGNYVNSSSQALGSASGVTLESVAKLAHTRSLPDQSERDGNTQTLGKSTNALCLIVRQLQQTQGSTWLTKLISDLEGCRAACKLLSKTDASAVQNLAVRVSAVERCFSDRAIIPTHHSQFMAYASARLAMLRILEDDLQAATEGMCKYFAEPARTPLSAMLRNLVSILDVLPSVDISAGSRRH